jgi:hypothetical protein
MAARRQLKVWSAADLGIEAHPERWVTVESLNVPNYDRPVEIIEGDSGEEKSVRLVQRMFDLKVI